MQAYNYVQFATMLCSIMLVVIFFAAWHSFGRKPHALAWSATFLFAAVQWAWNCFLHAWPTTEAYWMVVTTLAVIIVNLSLWGFLSRARMHIPLGWMIGAGVAVQALVFCFTALSHHMGLKTGLPMLYAVIMLLLTALVVYRTRPTTLPAEWGMITVLVIFALSQAAAGIATAMQGAEYVQRYVTIYGAINFLVLPSAYIGTGMFAVFILATDLSEEMKALAMTDQLTGCLNRRGFYSRSDQLVAYALRSGLTLTVISCDLDHFKRINDTHGHDTGDRVIIRAAEVLESNLRGQDIVGRIGGEEFALLLIDCPVDVAQRIADRIRQQICEAEIRCGSHTVSVTASLGVAAVSPLDYSIEKALIEADRALYDAKDAGRDRVVIAA